MPMRCELRQEIGRRPVSFKSDWKIDQNENPSCYDFHLLFYFGKTFCHMARLRFSAPWHDFAWRQGGPGARNENWIMEGERFFFPRLPAWPDARALFMMRELFLEDKLSENHIVRWETIATEKQEFVPDAPNPMAGRNDVGL